MRGLAQFSMPRPPTVRPKSPKTTAPTHGVPVTDREREFKPTKGWIGGARYVMTSSFGSKSSNSGVHKRKKAKPAQAPERRTIIPGWARKYAADVIN